MLEREALLQGRRSTFYLCRKLGVKRRSLLPWCRTVCVGLAEAQSAYPLSVCVGACSALEGSGGVLTECSSSSSPGFNKPAGYREEIDYNDHHLSTRLPLSTDLLLAVRDWSAPSLTPVHTVALSLAPLPS